jgi:RHS repeat-associated protein
MKCATEKLFGAGTASRLRTLFNETKNAYVRLNIPTACPPRAASRSTQGRGFSNLFHLSTPGSLSVGYMYNLGNQRTQEVFTAGNYRGYAYDNIGQLKTAFGKEPGGTTNRMQEQLGYFYDAAGNLNYRTNNALVQTFGVNNLNELTSIGRSGTLTVAGTTTSAATNVTVNTSNAVLYVDNTFASTNQTLTLGTNTFTAIARDSYGRVDTNTVSPSLPLADNMDFDLNGNLLQERSTIGGTNRVFAYDDENQLIAVWVTNMWMSQFTYDGKMRRRIRKEYTWNGTWLQTNEVHYVYDGNVVIQERDGNNSPQVTYTRGNDMSGSLQGAGGIGGLLARTANSLTLGPQTSIFATAFYHTDGNGNVTCLIYTNQTIAAKYEYDPYGNILSQSGPLAIVNLYRFSSKEYHQPSGLIYYLYRYYEPTLQRWITRDPIGEKGGVNLYEFVSNSAVNQWDFFGLVGPVDPWDPPIRPPTKPISQYPAGFSICQRNIQKDGSCDCGAGIADAFGGEHNYLQYVGSDGKKWGYGWGGGSKAGQEIAFNPNSCQSCKRGSGLLKHGSGQGKAGNDASDDEIKDCIKKHPPSKSYNALGYNCREWAKEAAQSCGLDCN